MMRRSVEFPGDWCAVGYFFLPDSIGVFELGRLDPAPNNGQWVGLLGADSAFLYYLEGTAANDISLHKSKYVGWPSAVPPGMHNGQWLDTSQWDASPGADVKAKRRREGRCEECGELLPMTRFGLGECPQHPTEKPEVKW